MVLAERFFIITLDYHLIKFRLSKITGGRYVVTLKPFFEKTCDVIMSSAALSVHI